MRNSVSIERPATIVAAAHEPHFCAMARMQAAEKYKGRHG